MKNDIRTESGKDRMTNWCSAKVLRTGLTAGNAKRLSYDANTTQEVNRQ